MPLTKVPLLCIPRPDHNSQSGAVWAVAPVGGILDAANEAFVYIFEASKQGLIQRIAFAIHTVTTEGSIKITIENFDGEPIGKITELAEINPTITASMANTFQFFAFPTPIPITRSQPIAIVIRNAVSGFPVWKIKDLGSPSVPNFPFGQFISSVGSISNIGNTPIIALEYDDSSFSTPLFCYPYSNIPSKTVLAGSQVEEAGLRFKLNINVRATGFWSYLAGTPPSIFTLYNDIDEILLQKTLNNFGSSTFNHKLIFWNTTITLTKNTFYRLTLKNPNSPSQSMKVMEFFAPEIMASLEGGLDFYYTERKGVEPWIDFTKIRPALGIIVDQIDVNTDAGAAYTPPIEDEVPLVSSWHLLDSDSSMLEEEPLLHQEVFETDYYGY